MNRCLLFVHAHPDDEASKGAATAARYVDDGVRVVLVTCTGGEAGEILNPSYGDVEPDALVELRRRELEAAVAAIGFTAAYQLGYHDSGYHEDPSGIPPDTFARMPVDHPALDLARIVRIERPQVVVTYPEDGGYPHPDHIMVHEVTMRALELAADPSTAGLDEPPWVADRVFTNTGFPAERVLGLHEALEERGIDSPFEGWLERRAARGQDPEPPRVPCDVKVPVADHFARRDQALRAHATQVDPDGFWFQIPRDLEAEVYPWECFTLLDGKPVPNPPADDLFAGLG